MFVFVGIFWFWFFHTGCLCVTVLVVFELGAPPASASRVREPTSPTISVLRPPRYTHLYTQPLERRDSEVHKFKVIFDYIPSSRPAWVPK